MIRTSARAVGVVLNHPQIHQFLLYLGELQEWNQAINLTACRDDASIIHNLFIDSLAIIPHLPSAASLLDIGAGAGLPGVPVKIALPSLQVTLLEATRKKANFLRHLIRVLGLASTTTLEGRAETLSNADQRHPCFDLVISRALSRLETFLHLGAPFVKKGGYLLAMKGPKAEEELNACQKTLRELSFGSSRLEALRLPGTSKKRYLILLKKL